MQYVVVENTHGDPMGTLVAKVLGLVLLERHTRNDSVRFYKDSIDNFDGAARSTHVLAVSAKSDYLEKLHKVLSGCGLITSIYVDPQRVSQAQLDRFQVVYDVRSLFEPIVHRFTDKQADGAFVERTYTWQYQPSPWDLSVLEDNGIALNVSK